MRAQRVNAFVFKVDMCRRVQRLFERIGAYKRGRTIILVFILHLFGNVYPCVFAVQFLFGTLHTKDVGQIFRAQWFFRSGVERWQRLVLHVCLNVIPLHRKFVLLQQKSFLLLHILIALGVKPYAKITKKAHNQRLSPLFWAERRCKAR